MKLTQHVVYSIPGTSHKVIKTGKALEFVDSSGEVINRANLSEHLLQILVRAEDRFLVKEEVEEAEPVTEVKQEVKTEVIPFEETEVEDPDTLIGESEITQVGVNGVRTITEDVTYVDGVETARVQASSVVTTEAIPQITSKGTKESE